jgi:RHS repeat-associated protein
VLDATANNQRYFDYASGFTDQTYEVGGSVGVSKDGQLIKTDTTTYTYDDSGNATLITDVLTDNDSSAPVSPYSGATWTTTTTTTISPDTGTNWCLTQPTQISVSKASPSVSAVTRTATFIPDYVNCRETQQVTAPSTAYAVTQTNGYDVFGNLNSVTVTGSGMSTRTTGVDWGATGQFPKTITNPLSTSTNPQVTTLGYDLNQGLVNSVADLNGITTSWLYDSFQRKKQETRPDGTYTILTFNDCVVSGGCLIGTHGLVEGETVFNKDGSVLSDGTIYFDPLDRELISTKRMLASGSYDRNEVRYDNLGHVASMAMPCGWINVTTACPYMATIGYDPLGRVVSTTRPKDVNNPTTFLTTAMSYLGDTSVTTDSQGQKTTRVVTAAGTLGQVLDDNSYGESFVYDGFGSLLTVTDSNSKLLFTAQYDYGVGAFQTDATDADLDVSTAAGQHRHFSYDALGELVAWSDANGHNSSETYDALGRPLVRTEPDLTTTWTWGNAATSFNIGKLASVVAGSYTENYSYDSNGRLLERQYLNPLGTFTYDWGYNANTGLLDTLSYPTSTSAYRLTLKYGYQNGLMQNISDANAPSTIFWASNGTNPRGQVTQETLGNGVVTNRAFDAVTGWVNSATSGLPGSTDLQNESYLFDDVGNLLQRQNNNAGLTENFYYQGDYRLDHSTLAGTQNLALSYDGSGNITSRTDVAGNSPWTYDANRVHAVQQTGSGGYTYTYDSNGNATSRNGSPITWTSFNHPLKIVSGAESVSFAYNQDHDRASAAYTTATGGIETTYFAAREMEIVVGVGSVTDYRHYIYAGNEKIAAYSRLSTGVNTLRYLREDHQSSVAAILNSDGTCYAKESFTAFGARRSACTWNGPPTNGDLNLINAVTRDGYTWQMALGNMGLNDMHGRIEDAITGRFLSPDPNVQDPSNTQDFNRYAYARNNPLSMKDPTGFDVTLDCENPDDASTCTVISTPNTEPGDNGPDPGSPNPDDPYSSPGYPNYRRNPWGPPPPPPGTLPQHPGAPVVPPAPSSPSRPARTSPAPTPQGNQQLPPCQTFAGDVAARTAIADEEAAHEAVIGAASSVNDFVGATADVSKSLAKALGQSMEGAEAVSKGATVFGVVFTFNDAVAAARTRDPQKTFDASYGAASLAASLIDPMFGVGMGVSNVMSKLIPPPPSQFAQSIAGAGPRCVPQ